MDTPAVDRVDGVPPAIAIDQTDPVRTSRSTFGTMTELNLHLKLLFDCKRGRHPVRQRAATCNKLRDGGAGNRAAPRGCARRGQSPVRSGRARR
jgi:excinuclease UvrABC ATPase subunit